MASTVLPNGIIIPEKYSRDWYADLYHNWQELDNLLAGGGANDGTLTIQKNGTAIGTFSANQATDETVNISVPDVNDGTLTIQQNGTNVQTFTANQATAATANIQCVDLSTAQTIAGDKDFIGTTGTHDVIPTITDTYDLGSSTKEYNNAYVKTLTVNGTAAGDILTHNASEFIPVTGTSALAGSIVPNTDNAYDLGSSTYGFASFYTNKIYLKGSTIFNVVDDDYICVGGATAQANGANIVLNGKDRSTSTGEFKLEARDGTYTRQLIGKPDGTLSWNNKNVAMQEDTVPRSGGAVLTGAIFARNIDNDALLLIGGPVYNLGSYLELNGKNHPTKAGQVLITCRKSDGGATKLVLYPEGTLSWAGNYLRPDTDNYCKLGAAQFRYSEVYAASGTISTSDSRLKNSIKDIDDKLLDAWENIEPKQYKFNDATEKKGEKARFHAGYLAQDIQAECEKQGINASDYGLFCYDEWDEQEEVSEEIETEKDGKKVKEKHVIQPKREKGDIYALRYEEALVVESKYLRRCVARLTARIEEFEKGNNSK